MFEFKKVSMLNIFDLNRVNQILRSCGKDMYKKYGLGHWNNNWIKNFLIVCLCALKNTIYLVKDSSGNYVATFQFKVNNRKLRLQKLATKPQFAGNGVGSYCLTEAEHIAKTLKCNAVCFEVYNKSEHAIEFYKHRGYEVCGEIKTLKYTKILMEKNI